MIFAASLLGLLLGGWAVTRPRPLPVRRPTFSGDIAPLIYAKCLPCHGPDPSGPFPLVAYADVKRRAGLIKQVVDSRDMPPWKAGVCSYPFRDDKRLSDEEIHRIDRWVSSGTIEGAPAQIPPPPQAPDGWVLGKPDLVLTMSKPFPVPADGPDIYRDFVIPTNLDHNVSIRAIDFRPRCRNVVHHGFFFFDSEHVARLSDGEDGLPGFNGLSGNVLGTHGKLGSWISFAEIAPKGSSFGGLGGWNLGAQPAFLPESLSYPLPKGSDLILALHLHPTGKEEIEQSRIGIYFAKKPAQKKFLTLVLPPAFGQFSRLQIPAGEARHRFTDSFVLPVSVQAFQIGAHAHMIATEAKLTATLPTGEVKTLLDIPHWDFNWQGAYRYEALVPLPAGTRMDAEVDYDNTGQNPANPWSPPRDIAWGPNSTDEMGALVISVIPQSDSDYETLRKEVRNHSREIVERLHTQAYAQAGELN